MKIFIINAFILFLSMLFTSQLFAQQNEHEPELIAHVNKKFGIKFTYPKSWELQSGPDPLKICEHEIRLRPPNWKSTIELRDFRWSSDDYPLNILLCRKDFNSLAKTQHYKKKDTEWVSNQHGLEMETSEIRGKGWQGIEGEVPIRTMTKTGEQGPELFIIKELIGIDKSRSLLISSDNTDESWSIDDLLKSLEIVN